MKVLVFAHTPPPFHGQSYMVQQMLIHVGQARSSSAEDNVVFYHVNARLSRSAGDIGTMRFGKLFLLLGYVIQGWYVRIKYAPDVFYYVPAPAKVSALSRDWLVLMLLASLFKFRVYHWHGAGLGEWVAGGLTSRHTLTRARARITRWLFWKHELSIVMNNYARGEVEVFSPQRVEIVANGIADPCPDFNEALLPLRVKRSEARAKPPEAPAAPFELLFLGQAIASKGLFDSIDAVALANARSLAAKSRMKFRLTVAGAFVNQQEEERFRQRIQEKDLLLDEGAEKPFASVVYAGYVGPIDKDRLLRKSDALCFASFFPNEVQPVSVLEALAYGMPVALTFWHDLPSMIPPDLAYLSEIRNPGALADKFPALYEESRFERYRQCYLDRYALMFHCRRMREAFLSLKKEPANSPVPSSPKP
jgi:glycosyltransferase involved in cell wall biosynthesis